ncbi:transporter substrate-binding domain-containing protein [Psychrosphaera sp. B3R10]|uniref:transporter substrate-binding domain-containing protein n=1 Tax=unclassified Psychrosphaera TaxID=2641570 RepID=UPI001C08FF73|nr:MULTISPECIES: transporter substrate-binding domain-containing protein [unclassified Psychrosphaera]MBU2883170.1 transporter substrate-binding domain-containing protein [Psychrosphaera sp. I2R16]MBU2988626.1 transporter substrate-binding domain-containing protein [Psychrosphaera sp. B3R10]
MKITKSQLYILSFTLLLVGMGLNAQTNIKYMAQLDTAAQNTSYSVRMLEEVCLVINRDFGGCKLEPVSVPMLQRRQLKSLTQKKLDIVWTVTTAEREKNYRPIRIPLMKGFIGYRIATTNTNTKHHFTQPENLPAIKSLLAAQGHDWPDSTILRNNGFNVFETTLLDQIYQNVGRSIYDYTLRGVLETYSDLSNVKGKNLHVDENLLFRYRSAIYYFVRAEDEALANKIQQALLVLIKNGTFDKIFYEFNDHQKIINDANLEQRHIIELQNDVDFSLIPSGFKPWYDIKPS